MQVMLLQVLMNLIKDATAYFPLDDWQVTVTWKCWKNSIGERWTITRCDSNIISLGPTDRNIYNSGS
jgi:hypothetical protein